MTRDTRTIIDQIVRENYGKILAILIRQFDEIDLAEEILQESILAALEHWPQDGLPNNPPAWLLVAAKRKAIDRLRRHNNFNSKIEELKRLNEIECDSDNQAPDIENMQIPDERLRLIFTCCHPALEESARVALTLKTLCGFNTQQVANAFVTHETTMAQRLVRAKRKIKLAGIPYQIPPAHLLSERLAAVLSVIYFIFNEGYYSSIGESLISTELCEEAIELASVMQRLMPKETEVTGLLALLLFHHSRQLARIDEYGALVELENQNRNLWDRKLIERADKILKPALMMGRPGPYQIQAAISAVHVHTDSFETTDWKQIVLLYRRLESFDQNPVIKLNLAVALSYAENPETGLLYLGQLSHFSQLQNYHPFHAARAAMLKRSGDTINARVSYQTAIKLCNNKVEKNYLASRLKALEIDKLDCSDSN